MASAKPTDQDDAQAELDAAKQTLQNARTQRDRVYALSSRISGLENDITSLTSQKLQLASEKDSLPVSAKKQRGLKDAEIKRISNDLEKKKQDISESKQEKAGITVPDTTPKGIEFGIQQCTPVRLPTAQ